MELSEKIKIFKEGGKDSLQIISDFDMTLTKAFNEDGSVASNSISVLRKEGYLSEEYVVEANKLADYYHPIEHNLSIPEQERAEIIVDWWKKHFDLLAKYGMTKQVLEEIVESDKLHLRAGFLDFFNLLNENSIPTLIFSAGVGEVISLYLNKLKLKTSTTHVISNIHKYDNQGKFVGIQGDIIHSLNKNMVEVKSFPYYGQVQNRKNIILIGDSMGDIKMSEGFKYNNIIRIGYFNKNKNDENYLDSKNKYNEVFDLVIENDEGLEKVINLLNQILL